MTENDMEGNGTGLIFNILFQYSPEGTEKNHKTPQRFEGLMVVKT
jgi:hypothetical protein